MKSCGFERGEQGQILALYALPGLDEPLCVPCVEGRKDRTKMEEHVSKADKLDSYTLKNGLESYSVGIERKWYMKVAEKTACQASNRSSWTDYEAAERAKNG